jgi:hypothetical protein
MHDAQQNIQCAGCSRFFVRAGALISHIENNECPVINFGDVEAKRRQKELVREYLRDPEKYEDEHDTVPEGFAKKDGDKGSAELEKDELAEPDGGVLLPDVANWPKLDGTKYKDGGQEEDLLTGLQNLELKEPTLTWGGPSVPLLFPDVMKPQLAWKGPANTIEVDPRRKPDLSGDMAELRDLWDPKNPDSENFHAGDYYNTITRKYKCPWPRCK